MKEEKRLLFKSVENTVPCELLACGTEISLPAPVEIEQARCLLGSVEVEETCGGARTAASVVMHVLPDSCKHLSLDELEEGEIRSDDEESVAQKRLEKSARPRVSAEVQPGKSSPGSRRSTVHVHKDNGRTAVKLPRDRLTWSKRSSESRPSNTERKSKTMSISSLEKILPLILVPSSLWEVMHMLRLLGKHVRKNYMKFKIKFSSWTSRSVASGFQYHPNLPMHAVIMEKSNDHFIVKIRRATPSTSPGLKHGVVAEESLTSLPRTGKEAGVATEKEPNLFQSTVLKPVKDLENTDKNIDKSKLTHEEQNSIVQTQVPDIYEFLKDASNKVVHCDQVVDDCFKLHQVWEPKVSENLQELPSMEKIPHSLDNHLPDTHIDLTKDSATETKSLGELMEVTVLNVDHLECSQTNLDQDAEITCSSLQPDTIDAFIDLTHDASSESKNEGRSCVSFRNCLDLYEEILTEEGTAKEATYNDLQIEYGKCQQQMKDLMKRFKEIQTQNLNLKNENQSLKKNISALIKTARVEINRKDEEINHLHQRLSEFPHFRNNHKTARTKDSQSTSPHLDDCSKTDHGVKSDVQKDVHPNTAQPNLEKEGKSHSEAQNPLHLSTGVEKHCANNVWSRSPYQVGEGNSNEDNRRGRSGTRHSQCSRGTDRTQKDLHSSCNDSEPRDKEANSRLQGHPEKHGNSEARTESKISESKSSTGMGYKSERSASSWEKETSRERPHTRVESQHDKNLEKQNERLKATLM